MGVGGATGVNHKRTVLIQLPRRFDGEFADEVFDILVSDTLEPREHGVFMCKRGEFVAISFPTFLESVLGSLISECETSMVACE